MARRIFHKLILADDLIVPIRVKVLQELAHLISHGLIHMTFIGCIDTEELRVRTLFRYASLADVSSISLCIHLPTIVLGQGQKR